MYAVIAFQWHQYIVKKGDQIIVDRLDAEAGEDITTDKVLLSFDESGTKTIVGTPYVEKATVKMKVVEHTKGDKVRVFKFQGKKRYHRTKWFTAQQTVLSIESV